MRQAVTLHKEKRKLKKGSAEYWILRWYDVSGKRRSTSIGKVGDISSREARKIKRQKENEFDTSPGIRNAGKITLKDYTDKYFEIRKNELAADTQQRYKSSVKYLLYSFGDNRTLESITPMDANLFKAALADGKLHDASDNGRTMNAISVNLHMRNLKAIFGYAIKKLNLLSQNPFAATVERDRKSVPFHYVDGKEFKAMMVSATDNYKLLIALCRLAGLRRMEAYYLEWQDISFDKNRLYVVGKDHWQPKDRETRVIPICPELQELLLDAFENAPEGTVRVCSQVHTENIERGVKATIKRAGLVLWKKPLHTLRKSCITDWAGKFPINTVMEWAGHSNVSTTQQYYLQTTDDQYNEAATSSLFGQFLVTPSQKDSEKSVKGQSVKQS